MSIYYIIPIDYEEMDTLIEDSQNKSIENCRHNIEGTEVILKFDIGFELPEFTSYSHEVILDIVDTEEWLPIEYI